MELENEDLEQDVFREKRWYHGRYARYCCVAAAAFFIIFVTIIVVALSLGHAGDGRETKDTSRSQLVLHVNGTAIVSFDPESKNSSLLANSAVLCSSNVVDSIATHADGTAYCAVRNSSRIVGRRNNSSLTLFGDDRLGSPTSLALDDGNQNLYAIYEAGGYLVAIDVFTENFSILLSNLDSPTSVALDYNEGLMFIAQQHQNFILRASMDGSGLQAIVINADEYISGWPISIHLKRLYWIRDLVHIESSDYEGKNRQSVFTERTAVIFHTIALDDRLYWLTLGEGFHLSSCEIASNDVCRDVQMHDIGKPSRIRFVGAFPRTNSTLTNVCQNGNGGCQHLCLKNGKSSHSCACQMGWTLNPDGRTCREVRDYLMFAQDDRIRVTDTAGSKDLMWPTKYRVESLEIKDGIDFDYDIANDDFYYSDDRGVYKMKLRSVANRTLVLNSSSTNAIFGDVAHDWYTGNLYVAQRDASTGRHSLVVFKTRQDRILQKTLHSSPFDRNSRFESCPYAIALHPREARVFFAGVINDQAHICALHANGTSFRLVDDPFMLFAHNCPFVSVDYADNRLYWIFATDEITMVAHREFDGAADLTYVVVEDVSRARIVYVHQRWMYLSNGTSVWRVDKKTGKDPARIASASRKMGAMKVVSSAVQFKDRENSCDEGNGGCEQFCYYAEGGASCDCQNGQKVQRDGRCS